MHQFNNQAFCELYDNGKCISLHSKSIDCSRGYWRENAFYDEKTGKCLPNKIRPHGNWCHTETSSITVIIDGKVVKQESDGFSDC